MDPDENLYCEREFTFQKMRDREVAQRIRDYERSQGLWSSGRSMLTGPADTQLWEERGDTGRSKADVMASMGIQWIPADKKSRITNGTRLLDRIRDHDYGTTTPGIVFFDKCKKCIQTIPAIQTASNEEEAPAKGGEDHWHDAALYAVAYASHGMKGITQVKHRDEWSQDRSWEQNSNRGQYGYG
jgi:hypothetical protein